MSCPSCNCSPAGSTCDSCGSYVSVENGAVQPVRTAQNVRVSDRNGLPRDLITIPSAVLASDRGGNTTNRDGSDKNRINLSMLRQILAATGGVLVADANGDLAILPKSETDTFLATKGGVVVWTDTLPRSNLLIESQIAPNRNRLLTMGCAGNGMVDIGFLDMGESDYIGVDSEGKPIGRSFCDAEETETLDSVFGCDGGVLSKITGVAGKRFAFDETGKLVLVDDVSTDVWVGGNSFYTKTFSQPQDIQFAEETVDFPVSVPETARWVQLNIIFMCTASGTFGTGTIFINGSPIILSRVVTPFGSYEGSNTVEIPYGDGSFTIEGTLVIRDNDPSDTGDGALNIYPLSYR